VARLDGDRRGTARLRHPQILSARFPSVKHPPRRPTFGAFARPSPEFGDSRLPLSPPPIAATSRDAVENATNRRFGTALALWTLDSTPNSRRRTNGAPAQHRSRADSKRGRPRPRIRRAVARAAGDHVLFPEPPRGNLAGAARRARRG